MIKFDQPTQGLAHVLEAAIGQTLCPGQEKSFMENLLNDLLAKHGGGQGAGDADEGVNQSGLQLLEQALSQTLQGSGQIGTFTDNLLSDLLNGPGRCHDADGAQGGNQNGLQLLEQALSQTLQGSGQIGKFTDNLLGDLLKGHDGSHGPDSMQAFHGLMGAPHFLRDHGPVVASNEGCMTNSRLGYGVSRSA